MYKRAAFQASRERDSSVSKRKERMVSADAYIAARVVLSATLTNDDVASYYRLTTE